MRERYTYWDIWYGAGKWFNPVMVEFYYEALSDKQGLIDLIKNQQQKGVYDE